MTLHRFSRPQNEPQRTVLFKNQFGEQKVVLGRSIGILAPAEKIEQGSKFPEGLDHFKIYVVLDGEALNKTAVLQDQFPPRRVWQLLRKVRFLHKLDT